MKLVRFTLKCVILFIILFTSLNLIVVTKKWLNLYIEINTIIKELNKDTDKKLIITGNSNFTINDLSNIDNIEKIEKINDKYPYYYGKIYRYSYHTIEVLPYYHNYYAITLKNREDIEKTSTELARIKSTELVQPIINYISQLSSLKMSCIYHVLLSMLNRFVIIVFNTVIIIKIKRK